MPSLDNEPPTGKAQLPAALELYDAYGLNPLAATLRTKSPQGEWRRWQTERIPRRNVEISFSAGARNIWVPCGARAPGQLIVIDCDDEEADAYWHDKLGRVMDETAAQATGNGTQYMFRVESSDQPIRGVDGRRQEGELRWEIKADGQGVIVPPSIHPNGKKYTWIRDLSHRADAPEELLQALFEASDAAKDVDSAGRSKLTELLDSPAVAGGRNNWLAQVAGHYARHIPYRDAYEALVRQAAAMCRPPLDADSDEVKKTIRSIWATEEMRKVGVEPDVKPRRVEVWQDGLIEPSNETGRLASRGDHIITPCKEKDLGVVNRQWMDADIRVLGITAGEAGRSYLVEIRRHKREGVQVAVLPAAAMSSQRELTKWLGQFGVVIDEPANMHPRTGGTRGDRLTKYLEAQNAAEAKVTDFIGIIDGDFVTHDEVIRRRGPIEHGKVRPDPALRNWAPYTYGFAAEAESRAALRRVLEFHDETVTAVFGAWWAAVILKPLLTEHVSQFPIMGLEAPSESGKTTGFFPLMHKLSGYSGAQISPTKAALRDYLSAHNAGYIWVDDLDSLGSREDLVRHVTVGGEEVKKGGDNHEQASAIMRAALVLSGETLGLGGQKALLDRVILLDVPSPKHRRSSDGKRSQWAEIVDFKLEHPDLTRYAGTLVQLALSMGDQVAQVRDLQAGTGRHGDKIGVLRFGARLLAHLAEDESVIDRVDQWCSAVVDVGDENVLTLRIMPEALMQTEWRSVPDTPDDPHGRPATPVLLVDDVVWFSPRLLARWWSVHNRGQISQRTDTEEALMQQARALGMGGRAGEDRKDFWFRGGGGGKARYWRCPPGVSVKVMERSHGKD